MSVFILSASCLLGQKGEIFNTLSNIEKTSHFKYLKNQEKGISKEEFKSVSSKFKINLDDSYNKKIYKSGEYYRLRFELGNGNKEGDFDLIIKDSPNFVYGVFLSSKMQNNNKFLPHIVVFTKESSFLFHSRTSSIQLLENSDFSTTFDFIDQFEFGEIDICEAAIFP